MKHFYLALSLVLCAFIPHSLYAQLSLATPGVPATQDFTGFSGTGFTPAAATSGSLDSDIWATAGWSSGSTTFGGSAIAGDFAGGATPGGTTSGGVYAYTSSASQPALIFQPTGSDWTPGDITLRAINSTGGPLTGFTLAYDVVEFNNADRSNSLNAAYAISSSPTAPGAFTPIPALNFVTTEASTSSEIITPLSATIPGITVGIGEYLFIQWSSDDVSGSGSRDEFGLDNIELTPLAVVLCSGPPTIPASALSFTTVGASDLTLDWTNGDGLARIVVMREGSAVSNVPADNTTYAADPSFGSGAELSVGSGEFIVFNGVTGPASITDLTPGTVYHVSVFEYNCSPGSELYLPGAGTITTSTLPDNPSNFDVDCIGETTIDLSWDAPTGLADGILIFARQGATPADPSGPASAYTGADADFSLATSYGTSGSLVYSGPATSATAQVSALTNGSDYTFKAYAYQGVGSTYSNGTQRTRTIDQEEVSNEAVAAGNMQVEISWQNPTAGCFDEILVVANETAGVGFAPTGTYVGTANPAYVAPDQVIYAATTGNTVTVTGLTNGLTYYFEIFVRRNSAWSSGIEISSVPNDATVLGPGELVIVAVNTDIGTGGLDQVCFFAFEDITPGTTIDFTDNGYERVNAGQWGDTEGTIRMTWNGTTTISAGSVVCFEGVGNTDSDFTATICGADSSAVWDFSSLNGALFSFNLNSADDIFIMQNGIWNNPGASHDAEYSGNILYGWTATGWGVGSGTALSNLFPGLECFNTDVTGLTNNDKVKYTGSLAAATRIEWIGRINDASNWTGYPDNASYNGATPDYAGSSTGCPVIINAGTTTAGVWTGNSDVNWFNCANWEDLRVPDSTTNVAITAGSPNDPIVDVNAAFSDNFGDIAYTNDLSVNGGTLAIENELDRLDVYGDFGLSGTGVLDMSDGATEGGTMNLRGNWTNEAGTAAFIEARSTVNLVGTEGQTISVASGNHEGFHNLTIDKASGEVNLGQDILVDEGAIGSGTLTMTQGVINALGKTLSIRNALATALSFSGNSVFLYDGNLARRVDVNTSYDFPVGIATLQQLYNVFLNPGLVFTGGGPDSLIVSFTAPASGTISGSANTEVGFLYDELLNAGYWTCDASSSVSSGTYDVQVALDGSSNVAGATNFVVMKRASAAADWEILGSPSSVPMAVGNLVTADRTDFATFSDFAIARTSTAFPVTWLGLEARVLAGDVELTWQTATESDNQFFVVERSTDGAFFEAIGKVESGGNSQAAQSYGFLDIDLRPGAYTYRVRQVDIDGQYSYSLRAQVQIGAIDQASLLQSYPNPTHDLWHLTFSGPANAPYQLQLMDTKGQIVLRQTGRVTQGITQLDPSLAHLSKGLYLYRLVVNGVAIRGKIVRQ